ncbi:MBL fold metallo-hydrolase [Streptomyces sp. NPDC102270]|uniref:MBL fold metallo-hydrolase n=1 Tax=Streptomyces sp. NPDC102270 TaxID=3366150 RepID=UPI003807CB64
MRTFTGEPGMEEIGDGVHAFLQPDGGWCLNNAGLIVSAYGPVLIDTAATRARAGLLRELAVKAAGAPPRLIVNTHAHGDHTFGNFVFPEALVLAHEGTRREAARVGLHLTGLWPDVDWGGVELVLPQLTFTGPMTLQLGSHVAELHSFGPAHSGRDTVVWLPGERVLFTGDLIMSGVTPFVLTGSVRGLRAAVTALRKLDPLTVVPGHGPVGGPELLDATERYLDWLTELARTGAAMGLTPLEAARKADRGAFPGLLDSERLAPNLHRAYEELRGGSRQPPAEVDMLFADMVDLHGGLPECHA